MSTPHLLRVHFGDAGWLVSLKAGTTYFACVFAVGFVLGPIRELWVIPRLGRVLAILAESVVMLGVSVFFARRVLHWFAVPKRLGIRVGVGVIAFGLLQIAEVILAFWLRGQNPQQYVASFWSVPGAISLLVQLAFGAIPAVAICE
jgi:hypothetical protein